MEKRVFQAERTAWGKVRGKRELDIFNRARKNSVASV